MKKRKFNLLTYIACTTYVLIGILTLCIQPYISNIANIDITPFGVFNILAGILPGLYFYIIIPLKLSEEQEEKGKIQK